MEANDISWEDIEQLRLEALQAGDQAQVDLCDRALWVGGDQDAIDECIRTILETENTK